ncbi:hypothetical protein H072_11223 [Dactylellina haptotyla CBS 200.50]|uniref:Protein kinase domain-containing protein n=1 Tax=Dactylellina haptotyla (strain CBS 200.50) TaxID=1284197 RepID=S7ZXB9_DACHA|nr:hypothetical protein H072_11223 [Dactylellina haptotyla CBS 200.50]
MTRGAAAPRKEQVFFSARSGRMKTKAVKTPTEESVSEHPTNDKASETMSKHRISTVASLRAVKNMALPNSKAHLPGDQRERSGSNGSTTLWGSLSTSGNHGNSSNPYAGSVSEVSMISSTISSSSRASSDHNHGYHSSHHSESYRPSNHSDYRPDVGRNLESRMSHLSARSSNSQDSTYSNHSALSESKDSRFWDDARVTNTVTKEFIEECMRKIPGTESLVPKLNQPVGFGDGLTETTYAEWIISRAPKFFLILVELGIPEQIFWITDDSMADDDLPIAIESIPRLKLSAVPDPVLDKKFHKAQYNYLLRFLYAGAHIDFEEFETVPVEIIESCTSLFSQPVDHVRCPRNPDVVFTRKKFPLIDRDGDSLFDDFMDEVESFRTLSHRHIVELWASYTFKGHGYLLLSPATKFTLRSFLHHPPAEFAKMTEDARRFKLLDWMRCLSDALAYLYDQRIPHGDIRPKTVVIDGKTGEIYFSDVGSQRRLNYGKSFNNNESERYEYSAPEMFQRVAHFSISQSPTALQFDGGRTARKRSDPITREILEGKKLTVVVPPTGADGVEPPRRYSLQQEPASASAPVPRSSIASGPSSPITEEPQPQDGVHRTFTTNGKGVSVGAVQVAEWICRPAAKSDVFSLGCIMLDMLTFHSHKKKLSSFSSARARHNRAAGSRGGGQPDSSFHANIPETNDWIKDLKKEAVKRDDDAVLAVLGLISAMLHKDPADRPTPRQVGDTLFNIMSIVKKPHCEQFVEWTSTDSTSFGNWSGWDDTHDYTSPSDDRLGEFSRERDSTDPHDLQGIHHQISRLSFGTFGGAGSGSGRPRHSRNGSAEINSAQESVRSQNTWGSGISLTPSRVGVATTTYV